MDFYETLAAYYDRLFPAEAEILNFLKTSFQGRASVLEVACGTGTYAEGLAEERRRVVGTDLDEKMIALAKAKTAGRKGPGSLDFRAGNMLRLTADLGSGFEGLSCIGNSLVHLADEREVSLALAEFYSVLVPGGRLALQIINFDRILALGIKELPSLRGEGVEFVRRYLPAGDARHVVFETELVVTEPGKEQVRKTQSLPLLALKSRDLADLVGKAGFRDLRLYGSYGRAAYEPEKSFLTVLEADRP